MKKVLCVHDCGRFKAGSMIRIYQSDDEFILFGKNDPSFKVVETFECDREEWIKHDAGVCPVPDDWVVCVMIGDETDQGVASKYYWDRRGVLTIDAYRVISTAEEKPALKVEARIKSRGGAWDQAKRYIGGVFLSYEEYEFWRKHLSARPSLGGEIEGFNDAMKDRDERPLSPQELAFAAKHPEPEKPKPLAFPDVKLNDNFSCHIGGKWG